MKALGAEAGVRFLALGCDPTTHMEATPVMPDKRYRLLRGTLPDRGSRALDTMFNSCTTQVGFAMPVVHFLVKLLLCALDSTA